MCNVEIQRWCILNVCILYLCMLLCEYIEYLHIFMCSFMYKTILFAALIFFLNLYSFTLLLWYNKIYCYILLLLYINKIYIVTHLNFYCLNICMWYLSQMLPGLLFCFSYIIQIYLYLILIKFGGSYVCFYFQHSFSDRSRTMLYSCTT